MAETLVDIASVPLIVPSVADLERERARLVQEQEAIDAQIAEQKLQKRQDAVSQIRGLMASHGITVADLASHDDPKKRKAPGDPSRKVAPKFRDEAGNTWSGRGLPPKWLAAAVAGGRTLESFRIGGAS